MASGPNPFRDPGPFSIVTIGGVDLPGRIQSVAGCVWKEDWNFQKAAGGGGAKAPSAAASPGSAFAIGSAAGPNGSGSSSSSASTGKTSTPFTIPDPGGASTKASGAATAANAAGSFATSVWKGALLAEEIEIVSWILDERTYDDVLVFMRVLNPKRGQKPPSHKIVNPYANGVGISRCSLREMALPVETSIGSGVWKFTVKLCEFNPSATAAAGEADPANDGAAQTVGDAHAKEQQDLGAATRAP